MGEGLLGRLRRRRRSDAEAAGTAGADREDEQLVLDSVLFDEDWYSRQVGERLDRTAAVRHYLAVGHREGRSPHPLFDPACLRARWQPPRLRRLGQGDPLTHYLRERAFAQSPHPLFDHEGYLKLAPEAAEHPAGPVGHYCETGAARGLPANDWMPAGDLREWVVAELDRLSGERADEPAWLGDRPEATGGEVSVLVVTDEAAHTLAGVRRAAEADPGQPVEVLVLDRASDPVTAVSLAALRHLPGVRVLRSSTAVERHRALAALLAGASGDRVVLLGARCRARDGWLTPLLDALTDGVAAVQAVLVAPDGTVRHAGYAVGAGGSAYPFLAGLPVQDARGLAGADLAALSSACLLTTSADLAGVLATPLPDGPSGDLDLSARLRAASAGVLRVAPGSLVVDRSAAGVAAVAPMPTTGPAPDDEPLWGRCGFAVTGRDDVGRPRLRWDGPQRWAIKNAAPAGPVGEVWGDTHFARSLADALEQLGVHVVVDHLPAWHRETAVHDDLVLVIRGPEAYRPIPGQPTVAWVISHPDTVTADELRAYDRVVAASTTWSERCRDVWGIDVEPMLQATDASRFHPDTALPDTGPEVLFVGNSREVYREVVRDAVEAGLPVTVYGRGWHPFLDPARVAGFRIDNAELSAFYRSAGVVLSDHFEDMRRDGFLANRLFDAAASGARVITDDVPGLGDLFGDSVQVYRSREELVRLATAPDPDEVFGDDEARRRVAERVRREHSFDARARRLVEIAAEVGARAAPSAP